MGRVSRLRKSLELERNLFKKKPVGLEGCGQRQGWLQVAELGRNPLRTISGAIRPLLSVVASSADKEISPWQHLSQHPKCFAISDGSGKTATGTICIEVPHDNDYCPVIFAESDSICIASPSILISARDINHHSYGSPFTFCVVDQPPGTANLWDIRSINGKWNENVLIL